MTSSTGEEAAEYVNALVATCQNPHSFYGHNLIEMLLRKIDRIPSGRDSKSSPFAMQFSVIFQLSN